MAVHKITAMLFVVGLMLIDGLSTEDGCTDSSGAKSCSFYKKLKYCTNPAQIPLMRRFCAKTCDLCGYVTSAPPTERTTKAWSTRPVSGPTSTLPASCGVSPVQQGRIVNGEKAKEGAWPWIASLQRYGSHFCGGTLIRPQWILTAAHCVTWITPPWNQWSVVLGEHDMSNKDRHTQTLGIQRVIWHPNYSKKSLFADHALIQLDRPARLNQRVTLGCLPKKGTRPKIGQTNCFLAGWGLTTYPGKKATILQQTNMPVVESKKCVHQLEAICVGYGKNSTANACRGDSGGPLMCQQNDGVWLVEGVASYVVKYCKYYTGYSPVNKYLDWIMKYIDN